MAKGKKTKLKLPFASEPDKLRQEGDGLWILLRFEWRDASAKPEQPVA
jgi:hypothetical protein